MKILHLIFPGLLALLCWGCMVGPDYRRPEQDAPSTWRTEAAEQNRATPLVDTRWWEQLDDPVLNDLISIAMRENKDLLVAVARVEEFAARYGIARSEFFPQVGAGFQYERQQTLQMKVPADSFSATLNASWEIDLWGRVRRGGEAARAQLAATEEGRQAVVLSLVTSVASSYINLRNLDRQLEICRQTVEARKQSLDIFDQKFKFGAISEMELTQTQILYEDSLAGIPQLEKAISQQENGLNLLLGRKPGAVLRGKTIDRLVMPKVPGGLPSELLTRRPDIRQAEQNLIAANAQIGVARSAYFPSISLTAMLGTASSELELLFTGPTKIWSFAAPLTMPIFTGGKIAANVKATEAQKEQALISYQRTVQTAFREVEDSLIDQSKTREQLALRGKQINSYGNYAKLSRIRYDNGYTGYMDVLDAERNLFSAQLNYVQNQTQLFQSLINLYKAMGGGWITEADKLSRKGN